MNHSSQLIKARIALVLWIAYAVVVWNVVFDLHVVHGGDIYRYRQGLAISRQGEPVTIDEIMQPAIRRAVQAATAWMVMTAAPGIVLAAWAWKRARARERPSQFDVRRPECGVSAEWMGNAD